MNSAPPVDSTRPPLVSIGLAVYNNERHLAQSIEALLNQTFRDFVLIISDNASTDRTGEICQRYAKEDSRIQYSRNPANIGIYGNFNRVFELSRSKYFKWATGDDLSGPEMLADAVAVLEADPSIALCYPRTVIIDGEGEEQGKYDGSLHLMQDDPATRFLAVVETIGLVNHHLGLLRSDAIRRTRLFGKHVSADVGFIAEMSLYGKFFEVQKYQFYRRFHSESSSWKRGDEEQEARRFHAANVRRVPFGTWLYHRSFWTAVLRSPLSLTEKARVCARLSKRMYWASSWLFDDLRRDIPPLLGLGRTKSTPPK
jgi:glycosyltransferase involved in cell wall biosynthesis